MKKEILETKHFDATASEHQVEDCGIVVTKRMSWCLAGITQEGTPAVAFRIPSVTGRPSIDYEGLRVTEHSRARIREIQAETMEYPALVLECNDIGGVETYCRLANDLGALMMDCGPCDCNALRDRIDDWVRLLRRRLKFTRAEEIGLWGELKFIVDAEDPTATISAWRGSAGHQLDFATGRMAVEIKTSTGGHRHRTSPRQVKSGSTHPQAYLCSMWIEETPSGGDCRT